MKTQKELNSEIPLEEIYQIIIASVRVMVGVCFLSSDEHKISFVSSCVHIFFVLGDNNET